MQKLIWLVVAIIVLAGGWYALKGQGGATSAESETGPIKVGVVGPFTGDAAVYGEPMHNVLDLAFGEINDAGGINGRMIEAVYEDGKCAGETGASAAQKLVNVDGVQVIIGGFCSGETIPMVPVAAQGKVLVVSPSASSPALTGMSPYFFRTYPSDAGQGVALADIASGKGWKKVAVIQEQTDYAAGLYKAFDDNFKIKGGASINEAFPSTQSDFRTIITKLKTEKPDALLFSVQTPQAAQRIAKQLKESGWIVPLLLSDTVLGDPDTLTTYASALEGALGAEFVSPESDPKFVQFLENYKTKFGKELPYRGYMSTTYDAVYAIKDGITAVGYDGEKLAAWSRTIANWQGLSGMITIGADGDRVGGFTAEIVKGGKKEIVK